MLIIFNDLTKMHTAIKLMVVDIKDLFTVRKFAFPAFWRCFDFFNGYPFSRKILRLDRYIHSARPFIGFLDFKFYRHLFI